MTKRIIAVFTGNRAEYGLQLPILRAIQNHPDLDYRLIVSGAHLDKNFGKTLAEIEKDGFEVHAEVTLDMEDSSVASTAAAIGQCVIKMTEILVDLKPDIHVVYADRFEGFGAVIASTQLNIPTAHIEGGDITEGGALDDSVRHAMSKISHMHFTTNQEASNRLMAMGEEHWRVKTVGFPAMDVVQEDNYATPGEISSQLGLDLEQPIILFTQLSVTTEFSKSGEQVKPSLEALKLLADSGVQVILTYPNNDAGSDLVINQLEVCRDYGNMQLHKSLGRYLYHGVLALAYDSNARVACVGNSSSGLKETPAFLCPTVNIGSRQDGRLRGENVITTGYDAAEIKQAISTCLYDDSFRHLCRNSSNPYGIGDAGIKIAKVLSDMPLGAEMLRKKMTIKGEIENGWYR